MSTPSYEHILEMLCLDHIYVLPLTKKLLTKKSEYFNYWFWNSINFS